LHAFGLSLEASGLRPDLPAGMAALERRLAERTAT